jgi:hypothetical protein
MRKRDGLGKGHDFVGGMNGLVPFWVTPQTFESGVHSFVLSARSSVVRSIRCNSGSQNWCAFRSAYIAMADRGCIDTAHLSAPAPKVFQRCCSDIAVRAVYEPAQYSKTGCFLIAASAPSSCNAVWIIRNSLRPKPNRINCQSRCSAPPRDSTNALAGLSC